MKSENDTKISRKRDMGLLIMMSSMTVAYLFVYSGLTIRNNTAMFYLSAILTLITPIFSGWVLVHCQMSYSEEILKKMESFFIICSCFSIGLLLLARTMYGACDVVNLIDSWHCNPHYHSNSLPQDTGKFIYEENNIK